MHKLVLTELLVLLLLAKQTRSMELDPENVEFGPSHFDQFCNRAESGGAQKDRSFISHGSPVEAGSHPYAALLVVSAWGEPERHCTASILDNRHLLTAASCLVSPLRIRASNSSDFVNVNAVKKIMLGKVKGGAETEPSQVVYAFAEAGLVNADYDTVGGALDIAVIRTNTTIAFNDYIKPVCLASASDKLPETCVVLGYGVNETGNSSGSLQQAPNVSALSSTQCKQGALRAQIEKSVKDMFPEMLEMEEIEKKQLVSTIVDVGPTRGKICIRHSSDDSPSICQGDDGGPLMCTPAGTASSGDKKSSLKQFGINLIVGIKCGAKKDTVNYFTSVKYHRVWLEYVVLPNMKNVTDRKQREKERVDDCLAKNDWTRISWQTPAASQTDQQELSETRKLHICRKLHAYLTCVENSPKASYCDHMDSTLVLTEGFKLKTANLLPMFQDERCKRLQECSDMSEKTKDSESESESEEKEKTGTKKSDAVAGSLSASPPMLLLVAVCAWKGWRFLQHQQHLY